MIAAIETRYDGWRFRSRTEARYAVFFNALPQRYEYEKEGWVLESGERYLPDYWLPSLLLWLEVKGPPPTPVERRKAQLLALGTEHPVLLASGVPGEYPMELFSAGPPIETDWPAILPDVPVLKILSAYRAARSARFEFGESGAVTSHDADQVAALRLLAREG